MLSRPNCFLHLPPIPSKENNARARWDAFWAAEAAARQAEIDRLIHATGYHEAVRFFEEQAVKRQAGHVLR